VRLYREEAAAMIIDRFRARLRELFPVPDPEDFQTRTQIVIELRKSVIGLAFWMFVVSAIVCAAILIQSGQNGATSQQSRLACMRTREIAPEVGRFYQRDHILDKRALAIYWSTIPKSC
jgi:hypothetical protein